MHVKKDHNLKLLTTVRIKSLSLKPMQPAAQPCQRSYRLSGGGSKTQPREDHLFTAVTSSGRVVPARLTHAVESPCESHPVGPPPEPSLAVPAPLGSAHPSGLCPRRRTESAGAQRLFALRLLNCRAFLALRSVIRQGLS